MDQKTSYTTQDPVTILTKTGKPINLQGYSKQFGVDSEAINNICKSFLIKRLYLVGSTARQENNKDSDIDLLVAFERYDNPLKQYLNAKDAFESAFNKKVDLIEEGALHNPYLRKSMEEDKVLLYETG